jgi:hypothetical protein
VAWFEYAFSESAWVGMLAVIIGWALVTVLAIRALVVLTASSHSPLTRHVHDHDHEHDNVHQSEIPKRRRAA